MKINESIYCLKNDGFCFLPKIFSNLNIQKSEICGLLGPNGAGKSSIYHSIIGLVKPTFGKIIIDGIDASNIPTHVRCSKFGISWVPQYGGSWSDLSVFDNLMAIAELNFKNKEERVSKVNNLIKSNPGNIIIRNIVSEFMITLLL